MPKKRPRIKQILLDVGNTSVCYGIYYGGRMHKVGYALHDNIPKLCRNWSKSGGFDTINVVLSSVVPKITHKIKESVPKRPHIRVFVAGSNLKVPVKHRYKKPKRLGVDRLVNLYGALRMYKAPLLVIDFGTAITADYLSKKGVFEGGMIIPGPQIAFQALLSKAALLPKKARLPYRAKSFLGRSTQECMDSGILQGYGAMTDDLIRRFKRKFGKNLRVLATGGFTQNLRPFVSGWDIVDEQLPIKSLLTLIKDQTH